MSNPKEQKAALERFLTMMIEGISKNSDKAPMESMTTAELFKGLKLEVNQLEVAFRDKAITPQEAQIKCADIATFAMGISNSLEAGL